MRKMQKVLEYYNLKMQDLRLRWCCDRASELNCPVKLNSENERNMPHTVDNSQSTMNRLFGPIVSITQKGKVVNASDNRERDYTPNLNDGSLSKEKFTEGTLVLIINTGVQAKMDILSFFILYLCFR